MKPSVEQRRLRILDFVETYTAEHRCPPTVREIQKKLSIASTSTVFDDINALEKNDFVEKFDGKVVPKYTKSYISKITDIIRNKEKTL